MRVLSFLLLISLLAGCDSGEIVIIRGNSANYSIYTGPGVDSLVMRAATEFQHYVKEATGTSVEIVSDPADQSILFQVEPADPHQLGYRIQGNDLVFFGGRPRSILNAVYRFLENEMDVKFYTPEVSVIPGISDLTISETLEFVYTPEITTRTVHSRLFYENHEFADKLGVTHEAFPDYVPEARVHTFHRFMPASEYLEDHPEYYALRDGRRVPTQLCLTNEEVYEIVRDRVGLLLTDNPNSSVISVSQDDNQQYCTCDNCRAIDEREGSPAGTMIHFVNRIASDFPDKTISTLAYQYTRKAPASIKPEPNVLITLCSIECDRSAPISEKCLDFARDLEEWSAITDNVRIWDYTTQFTNFLAPFPNIHTLKPNINLFLNSNAKWIFEQHSSNPSSLFHLRSYLTAKLLWDPSYDADSIINEFASGYYGDAGQYIVQYIDELEQAMDPEFFLFLYGDPAQGFDSFLSEDKLKRYNELFDKAAEAAGSDQQLIDRINMARVEVDYASLEFAKTRLGEHSQEELESLRKRLDRFIEVTEKNNITMMNEMRFMVSEYLDMYDKTIDRASNGNIAVGKPVKLNTKPTKYANEDPLVLTDGAYGGASFYANWLGFLEDCEAVVDLEEPKPINEINTAFLQVVNHVVFFPHWVEFYGSNDGKSFAKLGRVENRDPLSPKSKINDIQYFSISNLEGKSYRYIKLLARNFDETPLWHHAAGDPAWIFLDEIEIR